MIPCVESGRFSFLEARIFGRLPWPRTAGVTCFFLSGLAAAYVILGRTRDRAGDAAFLQFIAHDDLATFVTDRDGAVTFANGPAQHLFSQDHLRHVSDVFRDHLASPPAAITTSKPSCTASAA